MSAIYSIAWNGRECTGSTLTENSKCFLRSNSAKIIVVFYSRLLVQQNKVSSNRRSAILWTETSSLLSQVLQCRLPARSENRSIKEQVLLHMASFIAAHSSKTFCDHPPTLSYHTPGLATRLLIWAIIYMFQPYSLLQLSRSNFKPIVHHSKNKQIYEQMEAVGDALSYD